MEKKLFQNLEESRQDYLNHYPNCDIAWEDETEIWVVQDYDSSNPMENWDAETYTKLEKDYELNFELLKDLCREAKEKVMKIRVMHNRLKEWFVNRHEELPEMNDCDRMDFSDEGCPNYSIFMQNGGNGDWSGEILKRDESEDSFGEIVVDTFGFTDDDTPEALTEIIQNLVDYLVELTRSETDELCPRCHQHLNKSDVKEYKYVCYNCDENFYGFETEKDKKEGK